MRLITLLSNPPTIFYLKYAENWKHDTWVLVEIPTSGHNTPTPECVQADCHVAGHSTGSQL